MATLPLSSFPGVTALFAAEEATEPLTQLPWYLAIGIGVIAVLLSYAFLFFMIILFPRGRRLDQNPLGTKDQGHH